MKAARNHLGAVARRESSTSTTSPDAAVLFGRELADGREVLGSGEMLAGIGRADSLKLVLTSPSEATGTASALPQDEHAKDRTATVYRRPPTVILVPPRRAPRAHVQTKQQWEGTVLAVTANGFTAKLADLTDPGHEPERADFELDEVADDDRALVQPGAVFYWHVGYRVEPHGQKFLFSELRFRRLPVWRAADLREIERMAEDLSAVFGTSTDDEATGG